MTLILTLGLDMVKVYHHTKNEVSMSTGSKEQTDKQTDRLTDTHTDTTKTLPLPHTREVIIILAEAASCWRITNRKVIAVRKIILIG